MTTDARQTVRSSEVYTLISLFLTHLFDGLRPNDLFRDYNSTFASGRIGGSQGLFGLACTCHSVRNVRVVSRWVLCFNGLITNTQQVDYPSCFPCVSRNCDRYWASAISCYCAFLDVVAVMVNGRRQNGKWRCLHRTFYKRHDYLKNCADSFSSRTHRVRREEHGLMQRTYRFVRVVVTIIHHLALAGFDYRLGMPDTPLH